MRRRVATIVLVALLALGLGTAWASGTAGTPDAGFGSGGVVDGGAVDYADCVVLGDGSILTVGRVDDGGFGTFVLEKRTATGVLDANFGGGDGKADVPFGTPAYGAQIHDLAVAPDGRIFVAGYFSDWVEVAGKGNKTRTEQIHSGRVSAFTSSGALDTSFGTGGSFENGGSPIKAVVPMGPSGAYDLLLGYEETVRITTGGGGRGKKNQGTTTSSRATVLHEIDDTGADVAGFGVDGRAVIDLSPDHEDLLNSIAVDSQGRIALVIVQYLKTDGTNPLTDVLLSRYDAAGSLDTTFGTSGRVSLFDLDQVTDIAIDAEDAIVVSAHVGTLDANGVRHAVPAVERYDVNGDFDVAFDVPELPDSTNPSDLDTWATAVEVDGAGRVVVGTWYGLTNWDFTVVRCLANGTRDTTFGTNGIALPFDGEDRDQPFGLTLTPDDDVVMVGKSVSSTTPSTNFGAIVRWLGN